jgi:hypothetical protein
MTNDENEEITNISVDEPGTVGSLESSKPFDQITAWCGDTVVSDDPMEDRPLIDILEWIRSDEELGKNVETIRKISDKNQRQEAKKRLLPYFTLNTFKDNKRKKINLISAKYCPLDFDGLTATTMAEVFSGMKSDEDIVFAFHSPSGDGIKFFIELEQAISDPDQYSEVYEGIMKRFEKRYGVKADSACRDCGRPTYLSSDPDIYISEHHTVIPVVLYARELEPNSTKKKKAQQEKLLAYFSPQEKGGGDKKGRTDTICSLGGYLHYYGVPIEYALLAAEEQNKHNPIPLHAEKVESTVKYVYGKYPSRDLRPTSEILDGFYSWGPDIFQANMNGSFSLAKTSLAKFHVLTNAFDDRDKSEYFKYLVKEKHIPHLERIDEIGDIAADHNYYQYSDGIFTVHYAPLKVDVQDNGFIEDWLSSTFGTYKDFIKRWLAVYSYTNYKKLPTLILKGERGSAKNTFAECLMQIYPRISRGWHGEERHFSPEVSNKLLVADEKIAANEKQYNLLKQLSGQKYAEKEVKYMEPYQVMNNMNIIIMSNKFAPLYVSKDEQPTSVKNNQFFVYTMPVISLDKIDNQFGEKVVKRLGHYLRSELKTVFDSVKEKTDCRYAIECPITEDEKAIFNVNTTGYDYEVEKFMHKMLETDNQQYTRFFANGFFPTDFVGEYDISHGYNKLGVIKKLKEKGYLKATDSVQKQFDDRRLRCHEMTDKFKDWYTRDGEEPKPVSAGSPRPSLPAAYALA